MFRFNLLRKIGVEGDIVFRSVSKDKNFFKSRISQLGMAHASVAETGAVVAASAKIQTEGLEVDEHGQAIDTTKINNTDAASSAESSSSSDTFSRKMTQQELNRFTTSLGSKENLHNHRAGTTPGLVVDENGLVEGQNYPDPTRYGDWEYNGRCYDF